MVNQKECEERLVRYLSLQQSEAEHLSFDQSCHSVKEAALAAQASESDFVKNICMIDPQGNLIVAVVRGQDRASSSRVAQALGIDRPRIAMPEEILNLTGYPCGGTPSFGYSATILVDSKVAEMGVVFTGGGSENSLVKVSVEELLRLSEARVARVRK